MGTIKFNLKYLACLSLLVILSSFTFVNSNTLKNQTFRVNGNAFETIGRNSYILSFFKEKEGTYSYGNFIEFTGSIFHSYYRAPCGNDCFTDVQGRYTFLTDSTIKVFVTSITKSGMCRMEKDYTKGDFGIYTISNDNNTIKITK